jgi:single-strand DNA-binding protein
MQELQIIGHVGKDAEIKGSNGSNFISFTVAVSERYKNKEGINVETTTWFDVVNRTTELAKYIRKGDKIFVRGSLKASTYLDKSNNTKIGLGLNANKIELLSSKPNDENSEASDKETDTDMPF